MAIMRRADAAPTISVIVAAWQAEGHIARAVKSTLAQTERSLEIIVVDDASADKTSERALEAGDGDQRLRVIRRDTNGGPAAARNTALSLARGEWIAVLDSDDDMEPHRFETLLAIAEKTKADIIADNLLLVRENGLNLRKRPMLVGRAFDRQRSISLADYVLGNRLTKAGHSLGFLQPIVRRAKIEANATRYRETLRIGEDYLFIAELMAQGAHFTYTRQAMYHYIYRSASLSRQLDLQHLQCMLDADSYFTAKYAGRLSDTDHNALRKRRAGLLDAKAYADLKDRLRRADLLGAVHTISTRPSGLLCLQGTVGYHMSKVVDACVGALDQRSGTAFQK
jgi:succinoglycan biosynthesis protein ExoO